MWRFDPALDSASVTMVIHFSHAPQVWIKAHLKKCRKVLFLEGLEMLGPSSSSNIRVSSTIPEVRSDTGNRKFVNRK